MSPERAACSARSLESSGAGSGEPGAESAELRASSASPRPPARAPPAAPRAPPGVGGGAVPLPFLQLRPGACVTQGNGAAWGI